MSWKPKSFWAFDDNLNASYLNKRDSYGTLFVFFRYNFNVIKKALLLKLLNWALIVS